MKSIRALLGAVALAAVGAMSAQDAAAQAQRTFVAPTGNDANDCSLASPCRSFARAIVQTLNNGEIIALDSGGYGAVDVNKSVSIISPDGVYAGVSVFGTVPPAPVSPGANVGVRISGNNLRVVLRNLQINGQGGTIGIQVPATSTGTELHVERVTLSNLGSYGILIEGPTKLSVKDSIVRDIGSTALRISATASGSEFSVDGTFFERLLAGLDLYGAAMSGTVSRSVFTGTTGAGVVLGDTGMVAQLSIQDSTFSPTTGYAVQGGGFGSSNVSLTVRNTALAGPGAAGTTGVIGAAGGTIVLDGNTITNFATGVSVSGGVVQSAQNNAIRRNTTDISGALTPFTPN
jgi:hypothetical protein